MKLPSTDSIRELAEFWDTHEVTDFADQLEDVADPSLRAVQAGVSSP